MVTCEDCGSITMATTAPYKLDPHTFYQDGLYLSCGEEVRDVDDAQEGGNIR